MRVREREFISGAREQQREIVREGSSKNHRSLKIFVRDIEQERERVDWISGHSASVRISQEK